jgi:hypothetical protein
LGKGLEKFYQPATGRGREKKVRGNSKAFQLGHLSCGARERTRIRCLQRSSEEESQNKSHVIVLHFSMKNIQRPSAGVNRGMGRFGDLRKCKTFLPLITKDFSESSFQ